jgi:hypothetical protein
MEVIMDTVLAFFSPPKVATKLGIPRGNSTNTSSETTTFWTNLAHGTLETLGLAMLFLVIGFGLYYLVKRFCSPYIYEWLRPKGDRRFRSEVLQRLRSHDTDIDSVFEGQRKSFRDRIKVKKEIDDLATEIAEIWVDKDIEYKTHIAKSLQMSFSHTNEKDYDIRNDLLDMDGMLSSRIDELEGDLQTIRAHLNEIDNAMPDPILNQLLHVDYPTLSNPNPPIIDYVDKRLNNLGNALGTTKAQLMTCLHEGQDALKEDFLNFKEYIRMEFHHEMGRMQKCVQEMMDKQEIYSKKILEQEQVMQMMDIQIQEFLVRQTPIHAETFPCPPPQQNARIDSPNKNFIPGQASSPNNAHNFKIPYDKVVDEKNNTYNNFMNATNPFIYHTVGNLPLPKFRQETESADNFILELEAYMKRKRFVPEEWILTLPSIFNQDPHQSLWWQRTKLFAHTWEQFKEQFLKMYGSSSNQHQTLEKLLLRRQKPEESFEKFAFEMELQYRKLYKIVNNERDIEIIQFVAERALPYLKPHLLASNNSSLIDLINFASKIERTPQPPQSDNNRRYQANNNNQYNNNNNNYQRRERTDNKASVQVNTPLHKTGSPPPTQSNPNNTRNDNGNKRNNKRAPRHNLKCDNCPTLTNHTTQDCFRNKQPRVNNATPTINPPTPKTPIPPVQGNEQDE